jgi:hypothetical protein
MSSPRTEVRPRRRSPARRQRVHPVRVEIVRQGWSSVAAFCRGLDPPTDPGNFANVLNYKRPSWPALRRACSARLGLPEADLFPEVYEDDEAAW